MVAFKYRMGAGIPGALSRETHNTIEYQTLASPSGFTTFGVPGKILSGNFVPIANGDAVSVIYGLLVRPYPFQSTQFAPGFDQDQPGYASEANVLRRGYITVENTQGTPALNGAVYVRTGDTDGTGIAIGSLSASQDSTTPADTPQLPGATFMASGDANGNVEIAFNI